ncbi:hypothetical protein QTG54_002292 [Skeletonema marinoi]|uniref:Uncharacterized protein n=1 Tax=Skeletonema marinoi TaxID=267567 RepID=A0AAD8YIL5_9STRA|nr:hypothetical protein QTG54_002292 [Skeletonema marinoi]
MQVKSQRMQQFANFRKRLVILEKSDVSPASYLSPGLTNESACLVRLEVDMTQEANLKNYENQSLHDGLEGCEKDRGLEKLMIPRVGMLNALHDMQQKEGVKVFAALYSLALGMQIGEGATCIEKDFFPLVNLDDNQCDQVVQRCVIVDS